MILVIGWLFLLIPLAWVSLFTFFVTVPTFGGALFSGTIPERVMGVGLWCFTFFCWYQWATAVSINLTP